MANRSGCSGFNRLTVVGKPVKICWGPLSWQGLITLYVALGLFFAWIAAVIPYTLRAITRIELEYAG